jgi:hypothetical protein
MLDFDSVQTVCQFFNGSHGAWGERLKVGTDSQSVLAGLLLIDATEKIEIRLDVGIVSSVYHLREEYALRIVEQEILIRSIGAGFGLIKPVLRPFKAAIDLTGSGSSHEEMARWR